MSEEDIEYREVGHLHRQKVLVTDVEVIVTGSLAMSGDYESRFPLESVSTMVHQGTMRSRAFHQYQATLFVTSAVAVVYHAIPGTTIFVLWGGLLTFLPIAFVVGCLATVRKYRFAAFTNDSGNVLFSVSCVGPHRRDFDTFVVELRRRVEQSRHSARAGALA
jgi:hypothetical protein